MVDVRTGSPKPAVDRETFRTRFREQFVDPAFDAHRAKLEELEAIAWDNHDQGRKAPITRKAGHEFADPDYDLSVDWLAARNQILAAQQRHDTAGSPRVLVLSGGARNEHTCPGEYSKSSRLVSTITSELTAAGCHVDELDLSAMTAEYGKTIYPCKACVSTAMPLCHWPCSCYPNHAADQINDWMNEIYPMWVAAHGVMIVTPVHWYQAPTVLKAMMDRLVCADGGNPDPTSTSGKDPDKAKAIERRGWDFPRHLAGRVFSLVVHGDSAGTETLRRSLSDWLGDMGLIGAGHQAEIDRYVGYYEGYAENHVALDEDHSFQEETRNAARALIEAVKLMRRGKLAQPDRRLEEPRPK